MTSRTSNSADLVCGDCGKEVGGEEHFTVINPEGGYDQPQFLCCDACMRSGRWEYWKSKHWPNWPDLPVQY